MIIASAIFPNFPNLILFALGYFVMGIFTFNRSLLINKKPFLILLILAIILATISLILDLFYMDYFELNYWPMRIPLFTLIIFRFYRYLFIRKNKREPIDTFWNYKDSTPNDDRLFNIAFGCTCFLIPTFLGIAGKF